MADTKVSADASLFGLCAVILQRTDSKSPWKPVAYPSSTMTDIERHYAQIEKEAMALTWACKHFSMYLLGKSFLLETDHKPLISLLSTKNLDSFPPRILQFRLRMMRYNFSITHVPGKAPITADTLSRAPLPSDSTDSLDLQQSAETFISAVVEALPASANHLEQIAKAQSTDPILSTKSYEVLSGRLACQTPGQRFTKTLMVYELSLYNTLLMHAHRIE